MTVQVRNSDLRCARSSFTVIARLASRLPGMNDTIKPDTQAPDLPSIRDLRSNNSAAWRQAYPRLLGVATSVVRGVLDPSSGHDWSDRASQSVWDVYKLLTGTGSQWIPQSFEDLLKLTATIARRRAFDLIRRGKCRPGPPLGIDPEADFPDSDLASEPLSSSLLSLEEILSVVDCLEPPLPQMFRERFVEGIELKDVAEKHGISYKNATVKFFRAYAVLRQKLKPWIGND